MGDFSVVWLKQARGPCVLCGAETGVGAVGWRHEGHPVGPVCDACMLDRERILSDLLKVVRAQGNGGTADSSITRDPTELIYRVLTLAQTYESAASKVWPAHKPGLMEFAKRFAGEE